MIDIDPIAIATGGMWSSNDYVDIYGLATEGMIVELAIVVPIPLDSTIEEIRRGLLYPLELPEETKESEKKSLIEIEDEEVLLIIKAFIKIWQD